MLDWVSDTEQLAPPGATASVVIPARNAQRDLERCLSALAAQASMVREVIVVDDGSSDCTGEVAREHGAHVIRLEPSGPAAARNAGAHAAQSDVIVFLDADCEPRPGCVQALVQALRDPSIAASRGGYTTQQRHPIARFVQLELDEKQDRLRQTEAVAVVDTACAAYRRTVFLAYGGFDESFGATTAEDVELSFRLAAAGERMVYAPAALVAHKHPTSLWRYCQRKLRFGYFRARVYGRFPERMASDGYTPRSMPVQIVTSAAMVASLVLGARVPAALWLAAGSATVFLCATVPLTVRAWRQDRGLVPFVPPLLLLRSLSQAAGLAAGFPAVALSLARRAQPGNAKLAHATSERE